MYWITGILGIAFIVALFIISNSENVAAMWTSIEIGFALELIASYKLYYDQSGQKRYCDKPTLLFARRFG